MRSCCSLYGVFFCFHLSWISSLDQMCWGRVEEEHHAGPVSPLQSDPGDDGTFRWVNRENGLTGVWMMGRTADPFRSVLLSSSESPVWSANQRCRLCHSQLKCDSWPLFFFFFPDNGLNSQKGITPSRLWKVRYLTPLHFTIIFSSRSLLDPGGSR